MAEGYNPNRARCAAIENGKRCQLRGSTGHSAADGGHWMCAWHDHAFNLPDDRELTRREVFGRFLADQREYGCTRWDHRTDDEWWSLVMGHPERGSWDRRQDLAALESQAEMSERPGY